MSVASEFLHTQSSPDAVLPGYAARPATAAEQHSTLPALQRAAGNRAVQRLLQPWSAASSRPAEAADTLAGVTVQRMGLDIEWAQTPTGIRATVVKTSRIGYVGGNHTTAHVLTRRNMEMAITGKTYQEALTDINARYADLENYPGYQDVIKVTPTQFNAENLAFTQLMTNAVHEPLAQNHNVRLKQVVDQYEKVRHLLGYSMRTGQVGGVGQGGQADEAGLAANMMNAYQTGNAAAWVDATAGLLDTRQWQVLYGDNAGKEALKQVIVQHCLSVRGAENEIPYQMWLNLVAKIIADVQKQPTMLKYGPAWFNSLHQSILESLRDEHNMVI